MNSDKQAFLAHIAAAPLDDALRKIYADFLDELGEHEEAARQRKFVEAYDFIKQFTREQEDGGWKYDEEGERIPGSLNFTYEKVMADIAYWEKCVTEGSRYIDKGSICFGTDYAADHLEDADTRRQFWEAFGVITGVEAPEELRNQSRYRCAC